MIDWKKPIQMRLAGKAKYLCPIKQHDGMHHLVLCTHENGFQVPAIVTDNGQGKIATRYDIINIPEDMAYADTTSH